MPNKVSVEDLRTMFLDTLCMCNNKPYFIEGISERSVASCRNLFTQRNEDIPMDETTFANPIRRIGMVNVSKSVMYVTRRPVRRYKAGLNSHNTNFEYIPGIEYPRGDAGTRGILRTFRAVEMADAMFGKYPSLVEAIRQIQEDDFAAVAFDHQFALSNDGDVYYKTAKVGTYPKDAKTVYDLVFKDQYRYLISLLDNNHEKSISASSL